MTAIAGYGIAKRYGHVQALEDATVVVEPGEVVALFGDNGAGKSTLLNCLAGAVRPDGGRVVVGGHELDSLAVRDGLAAGVDCVSQDLALAPDLSVVENMFLGQELVESRLRGRLGVLARRQMAARARAALDELGIAVPSLEAEARTLSGGERQAVAVARAVMWARTAVLMDEPTAALGVQQSARVCTVIRSVAARGLAVLVASHDIPRMLEAVDRVVVLWRGRTVLDAPAGDLTVPDVVATMVGYQAA